MSRLRFTSAAASVDLVGVELLPARTLTLLREVAEPMIVHSGAETTPDETLEIREDAHGLSVKGIPVPAYAEEGAATAVSVVDRALLRSSPCLHVHAAAVAGPRGVAVIPAVSGSGKSTLAAAAMQAGLELLSDEAACLDMAQNLVWPHPRPLGLSAHTRGLLHLPGSGDQEVATAPDLLGRVARVDEGYLLTVVVLPSRSRAHHGPSTKYTLHEAPESEGLAALLNNCLPSGVAQHLTTAQLWKRCVELARDVSVARLDYDAPQSGAAALVELVG